MTRSKNSKKILKLENTQQVTSRICLFMYMMCLKHLYSISKLNWSSTLVLQTHQYFWKSSVTFNYTKKPDELFPRIIHFFGLCYQTLRSHTSMEFTAIKSLDLNINWICPREGSLRFIFLNFFFQDFLKAFFTKKLHFILVLIQTVLTQ